MEAKLSEQERDTEEIEEADKEREKKDALQLLSRSVIVFDGEPEDVPNGFDLD